MSETAPHYGACNLCEAICGLEFTVQNGQVSHIKGDANDPLSHGHICPKAVALKDLHEDPDRLRTPLRRTASGWQPMGWEEAFDYVAEQLLAVRQAHGAASIAAYLGNPSVHNYGVLTSAKAMFAPLKPMQRFSATSVDQLPQQLMAYWLYGHQLLVPIPDIDHTQYFLVLGANPMASNGSLMTVPDFRHRLKALHARGGKMLVLDPRRSETAEVADEHHFIRPGTDAAFLLGLLTVMLTENLLNPGRLAAFTEGLDEALNALRGFALPALAAHCGVPEAVITRIAREFAAAPAAACYGRMGVSTQAHGTLCNWLIQLINIATGNLDRQGGVRFTTPALDLVKGTGSSPGSFGRFASRVRGLPEFGGELPVAALAEEMLTPGPGQIKALVTIAGNPVLSTPNGSQMDAALGQLDFMVSVDFYLNETTRHAHVILPSTMALEHDHYDMIFHHFAVHNTARYNTPMLPKPEGALHDYEIFQAIGSRLSAALGQPPQKLPRPDQILDMGLQSSPRKLSLKALKAHPHGLDLGPLEQTLPERLCTANQKIQACRPELLAALARFSSALAQPADPQLRLIGRRHVRSNNSWLHNSHRLVKGPSRHQLLMHPQDLAARGLASGQQVRVRSRVGEVQVEVAETTSMMPGAVSLPHGFGHARQGVQLAVAQQHAGVSANDLTDEQFLDETSGNVALNGVVVEVLAVKTSGVVGTTT